MTYVVIAGPCRAGGAGRRAGDVVEVDLVEARALVASGYARHSIPDHPIDHTEPAEAMCGTTFGAPARAAGLAELVPDPLTGDGLDGG